ncbi:MAG TPA: sigma-70 family RNA polymerase sigma factor [Nannocystaceae bacterium]|nr:sigma-70 family RNA polymerase sigma factor [Nannocystaceae bacterium]
MSDDAHDPLAEPSPLEAELRALAEAGNHTAATTRAIEGYGGELLGYLCAIAPSSVEAEELFSELCERLWRALPQFRWTSSFRTWSYTIARNLARDSHRKRRRQRLVGLDDAPEIAERAIAVRTTTMMYMKTETKKRFEELRSVLDEDDRTLLVLRVDRRMPWRDIARVMADERDDVDRLSASLRKRFERVKERLREHLAGRADG